MPRHFYSAAARRFEMRMRWALLATGIFIGALLGVLVVPVLLPEKKQPEPLRCGPGVIVLNYTPLPQKTCPRPQRRKR